MEEAGFVNIADSIVPVGPRLPLVQGTKQADIR
jgi:hypothetical protein